MEEQRTENGDKRGNCNNGKDGKIFLTKPTNFEVSSFEVRPKTIRTISRFIK